MRVLHVNKFAFRKGGAEEYMLRLAAEQVSSGLEVGVFGGDAGFIEIPGVRAFNFEIVDFHKARGASRLKAAKEVLWSTRARRGLEDVVRRFEPDVIHLHNYSHQLSSSVIEAARDLGVPTVHTAHDYKLICPAYIAVVGGKDCFACASHLSAKLLKDKCHHGDLAWSTLVGVEAKLVRSRRLIPDVVIAPSEFMANALRGSWMGDADIRLLRNPATPTGSGWVGGSRRLLYVGRLSREKGLFELVNACKDAGVSLSVAGDGPLRAELESLAVGADIEFLGHVAGSRLSELRRTCMAQVIPSAWPENAPLSALEAAVDGVPLIATRRGGLPELQALGARMAFLRAMSGSDLTQALASLEYTRGDLGGLRDRVAWHSHIDAVISLYAEASAR